MKAIPFPFTADLDATFQRRFEPTELSQEMILPKAGMKHIDQRQNGSQFAVVEGVLWITQEGDRVDYLVGPGETFVATRPGRIVAQALNGESRFVFKPGRA